MNPARNPVAPGDLPLVVAGSPRAAVVFADDADEQTRDAADVLATYIYRSTGARLPVLAETACEAHRDRVVIYVGRHRRFDGSGGPAVLAGLDGDGFVFWPSRGSVTLVGASAWGTEFAVLEFLERYLGVRWLMPGHDGEDVPRHPDLSVPAQQLRMEPVTRSREVSYLMEPGSLGGPEGYLWGRRNRLHGRIEFRHSLWRILPPATYAGRHPEWYPQGSALDARYGWQPSFSAPGTVAAAIDEIVGHFDANPAATSISLAVNDYSGFCPADMTGPQRLNSAGFPHLSDVYYRWVNRVVEGVLAHHPGKRFGVLAYHDVLDPPSFDLHPAVVPFITGDRITWSDPAAGDRGRRLTEGWFRRASELGWWEYLHGAHYAVPKVSFRQMATNHRFAADHGVNHYFGETRPDTGGGPQLWISTRLQWDPFADVDDLLAEWCARTGGPAADDLLSYYRQWERFWPERVMRSPWYRRWSSAGLRSDYLRFDDPAYLDDVRPEDLERSKSLLDRAVARADSDGQRSRVRVLHSKFDFYRAAVRHYHRVLDVGPEVVPHSEPEAVDLFDRMVERYRSALDLQRRQSEFTPEVVSGRMAHLASDVERSGMYPTFGAGAGAALVAWLRADTRRESALWRRLTDVTRTPGDPLTDTLRLLAYAAERRPGLLDNESFERDLAGWDLVGPSGGSMRVVTGEAYTGDRSLLAVGVRHGGIAQEAALAAGRYGVLVHFRPDRDTTSGYLQASVELLDSAGVVLQTIRSPCHRIWRATGHWSTLEHVFAVSQAGDGQSLLRARVTVRFTTPIEGPSFPSMLPGDRVHIDDIMLYRIDG